MYYHIHTYVYTCIHFHWKELDHANERQITTLPLGPYHALWQLCSYVNFEHVQNLTTSLPFLQNLLRSYHASTTLIPFLPCSSGSHYALAFLRERLGLGLIHYSAFSAAKAMKH